MRVGGIKEKVLAAARFGIKEVILPEQNRDGLGRGAGKVRQKLKVHFVKHISELIPLALRETMKTGRAEAHAGAPCPSTCCTKLNSSAVRSRDVAEHPHVTGHADPNEGLKLPNVFQWLQTCRLLDDRS